MDFEKMKEGWQKQDQDIVLASVGYEQLFERAKFRMHKFEQFFLFASRFLLIAGLIGLIMSLVFTFITPFNFLYNINDVLKQLPYWLALIVIYYYSKTKMFDKGVQEFIKGSLLKIRMIIITTAVYFIYTAVVMLNDWEDFYKVITTNSTVAVLNLIMHVLIIGYLIYIYITLVKPVYSGLKNINKSISSL